MKRLIATDAAGRRYLSELGFVLHLPKAIALDSMRQERDVRLAVSTELLSVELVDDDGAGTPQENVLRTPHFVPVSVHEHVSPGTPSRWGAEEPR